MISRTTRPSVPLSTPGEGPASRASARSVRALAIGVSTATVCGTRDYADLLTAELARHDVSCSMHWLDRADASTASLRTEVGAWTRGLNGELERSPADVLLLHYSVFAYSYRGLPVLVAPILAALRRTSIPVVTVLHEYAYPWGRGGLRGSIWASTQRAVLIDVLRSSASLIVTTELRAEWLASRRWLPRRRSVFAPVFSALPEPSADRPRACANGAPTSLGGREIGLFGFAYESASVSLVLDALGLLREDGLELKLKLLGAPGADSGAGEEWAAAARARRLGDSLSFSGVLSAAELADALAACALLLFADSAGPSSRKTTLAGSLASGSPVVAVDGPQRWSELIEADAAQIAAPTPGALAAAIRALLEDGQRSRTLGLRGREFAQDRMSVARTGRTVGAEIAATAGSKRR